jgi:hypothetical protein
VLKYQTDRGRYFLKDRTRGLTAGCQIPPNTKAEKGYYAP